MNMLRKRPLFTPERSLKECMRVWETVCYRAQQAGDRQGVDFADKIAHQVGRPGWEPSPLQLAYIRKLVDQYCPTGMGLDLELVPGASIGWRLEMVEDANEQAGEE